MKICIINTGGTISCIGKPLAPMSSQAFAEAAQRLLDPVLRERFPDTELVYDTDLTFPESITGTLDSTNLQPRDWCAMARHILDTYSAFDGFVVLHGTDSMDFTGAALPFLLNVFDAEGFGTALLSKPVIITGSQLPMFHEGADAGLTLNFNTDAFQNFCAAVACARLGLPEIGVVFESNLYRSSRVLKVNASEFLAFGSPNYPALAHLGIRLTLYPERVLPDPVTGDVSLDDPDALGRAQAQLAAITARIDDCPVMPFSAFPAAYGAEDSSVIAALVDAVVATGLQGLILEAYGEGNFPSGNPDTPSDGSIYKALAAAHRAGLIIVDGTQVIAGTVNDSTYAAGAWLPEVGALSAVDMTPRAAFAKTMILRAAAEHHGWSLEQVKRLVQLNLFGEVQNVSRLDSRGNDCLRAGQSIRALDSSAQLFNDPKRGPRLLCSDGTVLWSPFGTAEQGRASYLVMQEDGNLVLRGPQSQSLWDTGTRATPGAGAVLSLNGSFAAGTLTLTVVNYPARQTPAVLYAQSQQDMPGR